MDTQTLIAVLALGGTAGVLLFALSYVLRMWFVRNSQSTADGEKSPGELLMRGGMVVAGLAVVIGVVLGTGTKTLLQGSGELAGKQLFAVVARAGYDIDFETGLEHVAEGEVLVRFTPGGSDGPKGQAAREKELENLRERRAMLERDLRLEETRPLAVDPQLVRKAERAELAVRHREDRQRELTLERDTLFRDQVSRQRSFDDNRYEVRQQLTRAKFERQEAKLGLEQASRELVAADRLLSHGLISRIEREERQQDRDVLVAHLEEIERQQVLIEAELREMRRSKKEDDALIAEQLTRIREELADNTSSLERAREELAAVEQELEPDRERASKARDLRIERLSLQIAGLDEKLRDPYKAFTVAAPWPGQVGFQEPSPDIVPADNGPLLVLYKPENVWVRVLVPNDQARALEGKDTSVELEAGDPTTQLAAVFEGAIVSNREISDKYSELRVRCTPPPSTLRDIALGREVAVRVSVFETRSFAGLMGAADPTRTAQVLLPLAVLGGLFHRSRSGGRGARGRRERGGAPDPDGLPGGEGTPHLDLVEASDRPAGASRSRGLPPVVHVIFGIFATLALAAVQLYFFTQVGSSIAELSLLRKVTVIICTCVFMLFTLATVFRYALMLWFAYLGQVRRVEEVDIDRATCPLISILVPAHNEALRIEASLRSLIHVEYPRKEIILVDDGSTDDTYAIAQRLEGDHGDATVTVLTKQNGGKASALNLAFRHSRGELILCVDADSQLRPDAARKLIRNLKDDRVGGVCGRVCIRNRVGFLTHLQALEYTLMNGMPRLFQSFFGKVLIAPGPIAMFRREVLNDLVARWGPSRGSNGREGDVSGPWESDTFAEDADLTMNVLLTGRRILYEPRAVSDTSAPTWTLPLLNQRYRWVRGNFQTILKLWRRWRVTPDAPPSLPMWMAFFLVEQIVWPVLDLLGAIAFLVLLLTVGMVGPVAVWYVGLLLIDLNAAAFCARVERERNYVVLLTPLFRSFYSILLDLNAVCSLIDEARGKRMSWA